MNNSAVEQVCETMFSKKPWQTPEVVVLSSDDTEFGGGFLPDGANTQLVSPGSSS